MTELSAWIVLAAIVGAGVSASAQGGMGPGPGMAHSTGAGGAPFALDGTPVTNNSGAATGLNLTGFSTTNTNTVVYIATVGNGGSPVTPTGGGLTWSLRGTINNGGVSTVSLYSALAASPVSGGTTFVAGQTSSDFFTALIFAFSGAAASPYDTGGGALPATGTGVTFTTSNADDILIAIGIANSTIDSPFTGLSATATSNFLSAGYRIVGATQSGSAVTWGGGADFSVLDAIKKGP